MDHKDHQTTSIHPITPDVSTKTEKDPVCGMMVNPFAAKGGTSHFQDHDYFFCNPKCKVKFDLEPKKFLQPQIVTDVQKGDEFTCPMHPQIRQIGPGTCPLCGMALEPLEPSLNEGPNHELIDMNQRFYISLVFSVPLILFAMSEMAASVHIPGLSMNWLQLILSTPVVLWCGWPILERGWSSVRTRNLNMFTLIALGTLVAYFYSEHPLAQAIVKDVRERKVGELSKAEKFQSETGKGISGVVDGIQFFIGNSKWMEKKISLTSIEAELSQMRDLGQTVMFLTDGKELVSFKRKLRLKLSISHDSNTG